MVLLLLDAPPVAISRLLLFLPILALQMSPGVQLKIVVATSVSRAETMQTAASKIMFALLMSKRTIVASEAPSIVALMGTVVVADAIVFQAEQIM